MGCSGTTVIVVLLVLDMSLFLEGRVFFVFVFGMWNCAKDRGSSCTGSSRGPPRGEPQR